MHLNSKVNSLSESLTLQLNAQAQALQRQGINVMNLTAGELDFTTPQFIQQSIRKKLSFNKYTPTLGTEELRAHLAHYVRKEYLLNVRNENIAVTAGAKQALFELFQVILEPGDEVIIPTPCWVSYEHQVALAGGKPVFVPLDEQFDLNVRAILGQLSSKTRAIILNSPHNPTGAVFSKKNIVKLIRFLNKRRVFFVVDDIYRKLVFTKNYWSPAQCIPALDRLVLINGFSKSQALTGWRIGYLVAHPALVRAVGAFQSHTSGNASVISQLAALESLKRSEPAGSFVKTLKKRRELVCRYLQAIPGISFVLPQGAFYFFIKISRITKDSVRFCSTFLAEEHVALVPGEAFHAPGFVRLSFAAEERTLQNACIRLKRFIDSY